MGRVDELEHAVDLLLAIDRMEGRFTELVSTLRGMVVNDVLFSGVATLDADGIWSFNTEIPFAAVAVGNFGTGTLTISNDGRQGSAPTGGPGVALVAPFGSAVVNIAGLAVTIYGNAGDRVNVQISTKPLAPAASGGGDTEAASVSAGVPVAVAGSSAGSQVLAAANAARKNVIIFNNGTTALYVTFGAASSTALFTIKLGAGQGTDLAGGPMYTGIISGIWDAGVTGSAMITQLV